jgi:WD40 repeat protein
LANAGQEKAAMNTSVRRSAWHWKPLTALLALLIGIALALSACGGDDTPAPAGPPQPVTPAAGDPTPSPHERLRLPVGDSLALAWSPDGSVLAVGDGPRIWLYDAGFQPLRALEGHTAAVRDLAWSPDGTRLASAALDNTVRVWNPDTGATLATLAGHTDWVFALAWSPDGTQLVSGGADNHVYLWDAGGGEPLTALGEAHVLAISFRLLDREVIQTVNTLEAALKTLAALEAEPLADLVARLRATDYHLFVTFDDPAFVQTLLAIDASAYRLALRTGDAALDEDLAALPNSEVALLLAMPDDPEVSAALDALEAAEAAIAAIDSRDDADLIRTVRSLQNQELVIVITAASGETTTATAGEDFIATLADLEGEDFTVSFGLENGEAIAAKLQDPDFVAALRQYDEAVNAIGAFNAREDANLLRLFGRLRDHDAVLAVTTGNADLDATLAALDEGARVRLALALFDETLLPVLRQLGAHHFDVAAVDGLTTRDLSAALAELPHSLSFEVDDDEALAAELAALPEKDALRAAALLDDAVFLGYLDGQASAQATVDGIAAREDSPFIQAVRALRLETFQRDAQAHVPVERLDRLGFYLLIVPQGETANAMSTQADAEISGALETLGAAGLAAEIAAGRYTLFPPLEPAQVEAILARAFSDSFAVQVLRETNGHTASATAVAWSPDGATVASGGADMTIRLWNPQSGQLLAVLDDHQDSITDLAWSPDGTRLASASWDKTVRVWDLSAGPDRAQAIATLKGLDRHVIALAWSPDGAALVTAGRDGFVRLWNAADGEQIAVLGVHGADVRAVAWSADGARIVSSGLDGTVRVWDATEALAAVE